MLCVSSALGPKNAPTCLGFLGHEQVPLHTLKHKHERHALFRQNKISVEATILTIMVMIPKLTRQRVPCMFHSGFKIAHF